MSFGTQKRRPVMDAVAEHLNATRDANLDAARAAYLDANGESVAYPVDGPVLPECRVDDPTDVDFDTPPNKAPDVLRRLAVMSGAGRPGQVLNADDDEPTHEFDLEWLIIVPAQYLTADPAFGRGILDRGVAEIETILAPLRLTGLTDSPETPTKLTAVSFDFAGVDFQTFDIGDHVALAAYISLEAVLDARSVLS